MEHRLRRVLIVDSELASIEALQSSLRSMHRTVGEIFQVSSLADARSHISKEPPDIIYIDPFAFNINESADFILSLDRDLEVVFVLFVNYQQLRDRDSEIYRGERKNLRRYFRLDKLTPLHILADEVEATLKNCLYDIELWEARAVMKNLNYRAGIQPTQADLCLVVMSFSSLPQYTDTYRFGIENAVRDCGYRCVRIDHFEHNGRITNALFEQIESARFLVADLTDARPNCYYEVGWAHRAQKDVILTIRSGTEIHFDLKDYNFIVYDSVADLQDKLSERIRATVGPQRHSQSNKS
jgi:hypothetical protein